MGRVISVFNQKGGVGKTTTAVNAAAALGKRGCKVLLVDMDPQGNATSGLGIEKSGDSIYRVMTGERSAKEAIVPSTADNVDVLPSGSELAGLEIELAGMDSRESRLKTAMKDVAADYDFVWIDCPPSLGLLSINALVYSDSVLIPMQCEYYALEGVSQLVETIALVRKGMNRNLEVEGILLSMFDGRNNLAIEVVEEVKKYFRDKVFATIIPRNIRLAEAPSYGVSVLDYDGKSKGAAAYEKLAAEILGKKKAGR